MVNCDSAAFPVREVSGVAQGRTRDQIAGSTLYPSFYLPGLWSHLAGWRNSFLNQENRLLADFRAAGEAGYRRARRG